MIITDKGINKNSVVYVQVRLLQYVLMWPIHTENKLVKGLIYVYFWLICVSVNVSTIALLAKALITTDLVIRSEAIDIFTMTASGFFKYRFFVANHHIFRHFVELIDEGFPQDPPLGKEDFTVKNWMKSSVPLSILHTGLGFVLIQNWLLVPIMNYVSGQTSLQDMPLPISVWYPFDYNTGYTYVILYVVHYFALVITTHIYLATDAFLFSVIYFVNGQIEILKSSLRGIEDIEIGGYDSIDEAKLSGLKKCVELHSKILLFLKELDVVFRSMICADVLHAIISLSFAMLQTSEAKNILEQFKMITFVVYCFLHQYLNSLFGQLLINQQESLMIEVYGINWPERSLSFQKSVHIMMGTGCVKPVKLSAWRMYFLQYETFVEFVRSMFSFFMVLRTLTE